MATKVYAYAVISDNGYDGRWLEGICSSIEAVKQFVRKHPKYYFTHDLNVLEIEARTLYSGAADEDPDEMPEIMPIKEVFTEAELEELKQVFSEKRRKKAGI